MNSSSVPSSHEARELDASLDAHDKLLLCFAEGSIAFDEFLASYDSFYWRHALDGHEADNHGRELLASRASRIEIHRLIAEHVLSKLASDADAAKAEYRQAGRIGPHEAMLLIRSLVTQHNRAGGAI